MLETLENVPINYPQTKKFIENSRKEVNMKDNMQQLKR